MEGARLWFGLPARRHGLARWRPNPAWFGPSKKGRRGGRLGCRPEPPPPVRPKPRRASWLAPTAAHPPQRRRASRPAPLPVLQCCAIFSSSPLLPRFAPPPWTGHGRRRWASPLSLDRKAVRGRHAAEDEGGWRDRQEWGCCWCLLGSGCGLCRWGAYVIHSPSSQS